MPGQESGVENEGCIGDDLVDPAAVPQELAALEVRDGGGYPVQAALVIRERANEQMYSGKGILCLSELKRISP